MLVLTTFQGIWFSLRHLKKKTLWWSLIYLIIAAALLGASVLILNSVHQPLEKLALQYLFPANWHFSLEFLFEWLIKKIDIQIVINSILTLANILVSLFLFPLKEKVSHVVEQENQLVGVAPQEFGLFKQVKEEIKLLIFFTALQFFVFYLAISHHEANRQLAQIFSYVLLVLSFSFDFLSPLWQRHKTMYSQIFLIFLRYPVLFFVFGAVFTLPIVWVSHFILKIEGLSWMLILSLLFFLNLFNILLAVITGTYCASIVQKRIRQITPPALWLRWIFLLIACGGILFFGHYFYRFGLVFHHKSQLLKLNYKIPPEFLQLKKLDISQLLQGQLGSSLGLRLQIENPTEFDFGIEKNRLEVWHNNNKIGEASIKPFTIQSKQKLEQELEFHLRADLSQLPLSLDIFKKWQFFLFFEIYDGVDYKLQIF